MDVNAKVASFFSRAPVRSYKKGAMIFGPGDPVSDVYYVQTGFVRLYCLLGDGRELTLNIFKPGTYFPLFLMFHSASNPHYFQTMTPTKLSKIPKSDILNFMKNEPDVLLDFTTRLSRGINGLITNIQYSLFGSVHTKLISSLLLLAKRFGQTLPDGSVSIPMYLTHQDIANMIGTARETVSLEIEKLVHKHLVTDNRRKITIHDIPRLQEEVLLDGDTEITDYSL